MGKPGGARAMSVQVLKPGLLSSVQDRGRAGHAALGVGRAGAMDMPALRIANALVGNDEDAAALEFSLLGPRLRFESAARIALCGAPVEARLDAQPMPMWTAIEVKAGSDLDCTRLRAGAHACLAFAGGLVAPRVLGSASSDVNAGLAAPPLRAGDQLQVGDAARTIAGRGALRWSIDPRPWFDADPARPLRLIRGAHFDALEPTSRHALFAAQFDVARHSNRVGMRLDRVPLRLAAPLELVSEPVTAGTMQLPPGGQPIVLMAEHPTTGGYPRIGQVAAVDMPRLAQRRPGDRLHFVEITLDEAVARYRARHDELAALIAAIHERIVR